MCFLAAQFCFASWIAISSQGFAAENTEFLGLYIEGRSVSLSEGLSRLSKSPISPQEGDACKGIAQFFSFIPITLHMGTFLIWRHIGTHSYPPISTHISPVLESPKGERLCALFTNRFCHVTGNHWKWKPAVWSLTWQVIKITKGATGPSKFAVVRDNQLDLERSGWCSTPIVIPRANPCGSDNGNKPRGSTGVNPRGLTHISAC